jgi:hypothetical protein
VGRARTSAISEATKNALIRTSTTAAAMCQASLLTWGVSQQALVLRITLEAVEHRVGGEPAGDLLPVRLERLLQPLDSLGLLAPQRIERGEVVVKEQVLGVERARLLVRPLGLRVEALLRVADAQSRCASKSSGSRRTTSFSWEMAPR